MYISNALSATLQSLCISDAFCILHRACICTHFSAFSDLHSRAFQAHRCASRLQKSHSLHVLLLRACVAAGGSADAVVGLDVLPAHCLARISAICCAFLHTPLAFLPTFSARIFLRISFAFDAH